MLPNLIIIGAGKCGTTGLYSYLRQHPDVSMSTPKELKFFVREENWDRGLRWYESCCGDASTRIRGEASPQYTNYPRVQGVPERMHSVVPEAKLIYLVRDPIERLVSYYVDRRSRGLEHRELADAVVLSREDRYVCASLYHLQLEQYLEYFPAEQMKVVAQEDMLLRRRDTLRDVFRFLGVDDSFDSQRFDHRKNMSSRKRRVEGKSRWLPRDPAPAPSGRLPWKLRAGAKRILYRPFTVPVERPTVGSELREALYALFKPDTDRLTDLTGMSFELWSCGGSA